MSLRPLPHTLSPVRHRRWYDSTGIATPLPAPGGLSLCGVAMHPGRIMPLSENGPYQM
jgi:hypothetical protein